MTRHFLPLLFLLLPLTLAAECEDCADSWGLRGETLALVPIDSTTYPPIVGAPGAECGELEVLGNPTLLEVSGRCSSRDEGEFVPAESVELWEPTESTGPLSTGRYRAIAADYRARLGTCEGLVYIEAIFNDSDLLTEEELRTSDGELNAFWEPIEGETAPWTIVRNFTTFDPASCPEL
ncbi:MAG TPA: hypothetical protein RMH85_30115, partial [Polyangiaceae bacterium LLY-WYZ-15_(1-7)]|nr:hypothetical protein [Polyangiaceae bacterium LLY-WYZ-15_(1-7)]